MFFLSLFRNVTTHIFLTIYLETFPIEDTNLEEAAMHILSLPLGSWYVLPGLGKVNHRNMSTVHP